MNVHVHALGAEAGGRGSIYSPPTEQFLKVIRDFLSEIGVCNQIHGEPESLGLLDLRLACAKKGS